MDAYSIQYPDTDSWTDRLQVQLRQRTILCSIEYSIHIINKQVQFINL